MRQIKRLGMKTASLALVSSATVGAVPFVGATVASAQDKCTPIHVVTTLGTGGSWSDKSTEPTEGVAPGYNITKDLIDIHGADKVSGWNTNYPSSVGAISMLWGLSGMKGGKEQVSFGKSIQDGVKKTDDHISQYKSACPNTKFVLVGYSQGASVAGDVARDISAGKVSGVSPDDVTNVLLIADPGRSSNSAYESYTGTPSKLYGPIPPGVMGKNFEIISPGSDARADRIGWTGERPGRFEGMYGKVLSLCAEDDLACSAPPNSFLRSLADYAMVETQISSFDADLGNRIQVAVDHFKASGGIQAAQSGDIAKLQKLLSESAVKANFTAADIPALLALVKEISDLVNKIENECGGLDVGEAIKSMFVYLVPSLVENNLNVAGLKALWGQIPPEFKGMADDGLRSIVAGASSAFPAAAPFLNGVNSVDDLLNALSMPGVRLAADWILDKMHDVVLRPVYGWVGNSLGMDPNKNDLTTLGQQLAYLGGFTMAHGSYWRTTMIGEKTAAEYGRDWIKESVDNALAGKSYVAPAKSRNLTDASLEQTLESQTGADGKVVCNPSELDTGLDSEKGDSVPSEEAMPGGSGAGSDTATRPGTETTGVSPSTGASKPGSSTSPATSVAPSTGAPKPGSGTKVTSAVPSTTAPKPGTGTEVTSGVPSTAAPKPGTGAEVTSAVPSTGAPKPGTGTSAKTSPENTPKTSESQAGDESTTLPDSANIPDSGVGVESDVEGTESAGGNVNGVDNSDENVAETSPQEVSPTTVSEVDSSTVNNNDSNRSVLALTGANVLGLLSLASGLILLAGAVIFSRRTR